MSFSQPVASGTESSGGAQKPPGEDPFDAFDQKNQIQSLYEQEMLEFNKLAQGNAEAALMFFALVLSNTILNYQGAEINIESSLMNTMSLLNTDLSHINSDINNIFQDIEKENANPNSANQTQEDTDIQTFMNDTYQYYTDLNFYFNSGGTLESNGSSVAAPFKNENFVNAIDGDFNTFTVSNNGTTESLFAAFAANSANWNDIGTSLETLFENAYSGASGGTGSGGGDSSGMQGIDDVVSNAETQQNQINSVASTNLTADQQNFNSYEGTMKNILTMISQLIQEINGQIAQSSS